MQVQGTLLGTGERCGNVNLTTVIGAMQLRGEAEFVSPEQLTGLTSLAHSAYAAFGLEAPHGAPIVGPGAFGTWAGMHGSSERKNPGAYLWCDPAQVGANPVIGVNAQSGRANIMLLAESLGVPLDSAQAQAVMDANLAMIEGGGFTASEISFRLACMKVLKTLPNWFSVKSWRVFDESDEIGTRFVQAFMTLSIGDSTVATTRAEGAGPVDALTKAMRRELEKWYPSMAEVRLGTFTVTALDVSANDTAAHVRVTVSFHADGHDPWTTAGREQRSEPGRADGDRGWLSVLAAEEICRGSDSNRCDLTHSILTRPRYTSLQNPANRVGFTRCGGFSLPVFRGLTRQFRRGGLLCLLPFFKRRGSNPHRKQTSTMKTGGGHGKTGRAALFHPPHGAPGGDGQC